MQPEWTHLHANMRVSQWASGSCIFTALHWYEACVLTLHAKRRRKHSSQNNKHLPHKAPLSHLLWDSSHHTTLTKPRSSGDFFGITWAMMALIFHPFCSTLTASCKIFLAATQANNEVNVSWQSRREHIFLSSFHTAIYFLSDRKSDGSSSISLVRGSLSCSGDL